MRRQSIVLSGVAVCVAVLLLGMAARAATTVQIGSSGKTYASTAVRCAASPVTGELSPVVEAGLFNPKKNATAEIVLNGSPWPTSRATLRPLMSGSSTATTRWWWRSTAGRPTCTRSPYMYTFTVQPGMCALPDTSGNTFSADGTLEYAASQKSFATVTPGCALNPATGLAQPYVHLVDNGNYLLNVSVNGEPLTQLSATRPHTPVFLSAGPNVIAVANGYVSVDYYVRDGGAGTCALP